MTVEIKHSTKLPEGWHNTEKYGEVYVSPGGVAWVVQQWGDKLESVAVKLSKDDIIQKTSAIRTKRAAAEKRRYKLSQASQKTAYFNAKRCQQG